MSNLKQQPTVKLLGRNYDVFSLFLLLKEKLDSKECFLLESIEGRSRALYSFLAYTPDYTLLVKNGEVKIKDVNSEVGERLLSTLPRDIAPDRGVHNIEDNVENKITALNLVEQYIPILNRRKPRIFRRQVFYGGYLGCIAYDSVAPWVGYRVSSVTPDVMLGMHTHVLIYDHRRSALFYIDNDGREDTVNENVSTLKRHLSHYRTTRTTYPQAEASIDMFKSNTSEESFQSMIETAKNYIHGGEILQTVLSRRVDREIRASDEDTYGALRRLNPSPYMYYLNFGGLRLIGSSPEALVTLDGVEIRTVPIAGTRRRGRTLRDELLMQRELMADLKERAEHVMLVDLARNDVSKISQPGTVKTKRLMTLRKFKHVMHLVTTVTGELRPGLKRIDVLKSVFPAGTVSGAPKLRAMEIINELEKDPRGIYAGGTGYIAFNGDMDWAITIRTIVLDGKMLSLQAGAGVVADSQPHLEWIETENKMRSLLKAVSMAEERQYASVSH